MRVTFIYLDRGQVFKRILITFSKLRRLGIRSFPKFLKLLLSPTGFLIRNGLTASGFLQGSPYLLLSFFVRSFNAVLGWAYNHIHSPSHVIHRLLLDTFRFESLGLGTVCGWTYNLLHSSSLVIHRLLLDTLFDCVF